ncbi:MAG: phosphatase PAP2 family protein [Actinomycetota bacterium]
MLGGHRLVVPLVVAVFAALAMAAARDAGAALLPADRALADALRQVRSPLVRDTMRVATQFGNNAVVFVLGALAALVVRRRCSVLAGSLVVAVLARPGLEWLLKEIVGRDRPPSAVALGAEGPSFPSGHVLAAIALWGLLPPVVAALGARRRLWWSSVVAAGAAVVAVAASRVYLGLHWPSDIAGSLLVGAVYLLAVEALMRACHRRRPCRPRQVALLQR